MHMRARACRLHGTDRAPKHGLTHRQEHAEHLKLDGRDLRELRAVAGSAAPERAAPAAHLLRPSFESGAVGVFGLRFRG